MLSNQSHNSLSRRGSKLLVEVVIGVIGILGIMLAQAGENQMSSSLTQVDNGKAMIASELKQVTPEIDWVDILF